MEKFIGDAVMAVWGAPVAREDDAERAVRAGLELVAAVAVYGEQRGLGQLRARAGVVTGEVASWTSPGEGLVSGDRVNTAARVQSVAEPGQVLVDEATRVATQAAIAYAAAGEHTVKGKAEPLVLWRAARVVANVGGVQRVDGLEAGFVGRARELALVKELFHASAEGHRARLVVVSGAAGVGKSRLGWEFEKYVDGLAATVWWHRGRCLSYGDGVAFWALAEMVRQRFDIAEDDPADVSDDQTHRPAAHLDPGCGGAEVRASPPAGAGRWQRRRPWPRRALRGVAAVPGTAGLGRAGGVGGRGPALGRQRAVGLLGVPAGLVRGLPDLPARRSPARSWPSGDPGWLADRRNATMLHLDPLPAPVLDELLDDLVPGMPTAAKARIAERAEGIPLYAVETIRALVDRDVVIPSEGVYRLVGDLGDLTVPATLTSLLASRLDGLPSTERDLVKGLAVLGGSFPGLRSPPSPTPTPPAVEQMLLQPGPQGDPHRPLRPAVTRTRPLRVHPDHAARQVAHDMLTKRERKTRHLAAAEHLRNAFPDDGDEVAEVIAAHYLRRPHRRTTRPRRRHDPHQRRHQPTPAPANAPDSSAPPTPPKTTTTPPPGWPPMRSRPHPLHRDQPPTWLPRPDVTATPSTSTRPPPPTTPPPDRPTRRRPPPSTHRHLPAQTRPDRGSRPAHANSCRRSRCPGGSVQANRHSPSCTPGSGTLWCSWVAPRKRPTTSNKRLLSPPPTSYHGSSREHWA
ncbi:MAG: adenylate/guanylate cyclase domain-containing protein [Nocardioidaceae bacterium]